MLRHSVPHALAKYRDIVQRRSLTPRPALLCCQSEGINTAQYPKWESNPYVTLTPRRCTITLCKRQNSFSYLILCYRRVIVLCYTHKLISNRVIRNDILLIIVMYWPKCCYTRLDEAIIGPEQYKGITLDSPRPNSLILNRRQTKTLSQ